MPNPVIRRRVRLEVVDDSTSRQLNEIASRLSSDDSISAYSISVNKVSGVSKIVAKNIQGQTVTRELIGPGLEATMVHTPNGRGSRDDNMHTLREKGLTQADIASRLGVSQALVSNVLRKRIRNV